MKIALIGPGIIDIPPKGWGAVETIIHEMQKGLLRRGHEVLIVNTKEKAGIISSVNQFAPDFVYCQYDEHIDIMDKIECKNKAITSHFGYLDQVWRFQKYKRNIHDKIIASGDVHILALSPSIARVYLSGGADRTRVHVLPNGVNVSCFRFSGEPRYHSKSICLGKIDSRKRQSLLQKLDADVDFVGNLCPATAVKSGFDTKARNYIGEWDKDTVYKDLTDYASLVLLSNGEAHPLVCIEGMSAGLGLVVSEWATANLDLTLPFITVVPERKMIDRDYIRSAIIENREISLTHRSEIAEYARTFDYDVMLNRLETVMLKIADEKNGLEIRTTSQTKKKVAIVATLIGKYYDHYFDDLANSIKDYFHNFDVKLFCFTDREPAETPTSDLVEFITVRNVGWPFNSLLRFQMLTSISEKLQLFDNVFAIDGDMVFNQEIEHSLLDQDLFAVLHPGFEYKTSHATFEVDVKSTAFVRKEARSHYVQGCFFGGKTEAFLYLCRTLRDAVQKDLFIGDIPVWHDESYLNWFFSQHEYCAVSSAYAYPEGTKALQKPYLTHRKKEHSSIRNVKFYGPDAEALLSGQGEVDDTEMYRTLYLRTHEKTQRLESEIIRRNAARFPVRRVLDKSRRFRKTVGAFIRTRIGTR